MILYHNNIINDTYPVDFTTSSFEPKDFQYGYFIINGTEYRFYNKDFVKAVETIKLWEILTEKE